MTRHHEEAVIVPRIMHIKLFVVVGAAEVVACKGLLRQQQQSERETRKGITAWGEESRERERTDFTWK